MPKLILKKARTFDLPRGVKVITNDEFITLAKKRQNGVFDLFTCEAEVIDEIILADENNWFQMTAGELQKILDL